MSNLLTFFGLLTKESRKQID